MKSHSRALATFQNIGNARKPEAVWNKCTLRSLIRLCTYSDNSQSFNSISTERLFKCCENREERVKRWTLKKFAKTRRVKSVVSLCKVRICFKRVSCCHVLRQKHDVPVARSATVCQTSVLLASVVRRHIVLMNVCCRLFAWPGQTLTCFPFSRQAIPEQNSNDWFGPRASYVIST